MWRRVVLGVVIAVVAVAGVVGLFAWRDIRAARQQVQGVRSAVTRALGPAALRSDEERARSVRSLAAAAVDVEAAADQLRYSRAISIAGGVPGLRRQRSGMLALLDDATVGLTTARDLLDVAGQGSTRVSGGRLPVDRMPDLEARSRAAAKTYGGLQRGDDGLWSALASARREFDSAARDAETRLSSAADALAVGHGFLGGAEPRRYLIALQNNAEMRDQGMVLSYAEATFTDGRPSLGRRGSIGALLPKTDLDIPMSEGQRQIFGHLRPTYYWQNVNATADFPWSAGAMRTMYKQATDTDIDGVIAIDVPGIAAVLGVTGPVRVAGVGEQISRDNLATIVLDEFYRDSPVGSQAERREKLADVVDAVFTAISTRDLDAVALGQALGEAGRGGHFRLWSTAAEEEATIERLGLGGGPATEMADRTIHLSIQNATASKLDYFVRPEVKVGVRVDREGTARIETTVTIHNQAPTTSGRSYQLGPVRAQTEPGQYITRVYFWGPSGAIQDQSVEESGLRLNQDPIVVNAGETGTIVFRTEIRDAVRNGRLQLRLVPQPRLRPIDLSVVIAADGWKVSGGADFFAAPWDRTFVRTWRLQRSG